MSIIDLLWKLARGTDVTLNMYDPALPLKIQYKQGDTSANTADRAGAEALSCGHGLHDFFYLCLYIKATNNSDVHLKKYSPCHCISA